MTRLRLVLRDAGYPPAEIDTTAAELLHNWGYEAAYRIVRDAERDAKRRARHKTQGQ